MSNPIVTSIQDDVDKAIHDKTIALSAVIALASRKAAERMVGLIDSSSESIALKASSDILDRNPETSKTQKHFHAGFSLEGEDAKALASALVRAAEVRQRYDGIGEGDFVRVQLDDPSKGTKNVSEATEVGGGTGDGVSVRSVPIPPDGDSRPGA